ncbi:MAG TPA: glycosyltransferase family 4 protein, partial [Bacteroidales bacterium]|nr:glycosyltransferase family 4 protein [Bacteroidales bacterium]
LFHRADILISNDLDTLPANYLAAKLKRARLFFDSHEYFSETPEVYQRAFVRKSWLIIERLCVGGCNVHYTVSQSLANIYMNKYKLHFHVIRNVPNLYRVTEIPAEETPMILYQGSINMGRGLELMIEAMPYIPQAKLVIAGDGPELGKLRTLAGKLPVDGKVEFTGNIPPDQLRGLTMRASVGISIEEPMGASYISALPNKLFDYIAAQVPVLVSDLPEMRAIVDTYGVGMILDERTPQRLASLTNLMISDAGRRSGWKDNLRKAARELCWENESLKLKMLLDEDD